MAAPNSPPHSSSHSTPATAATSSISYFPHDAIPYSEEFENAMMELILNPPATDSGLRVIGRGSSEKSVPNVSVRIDDMDLSALPNISLDEVPLPLEDPRRIYASFIPGVRLTHPGGHLEGGAPAPYSEPVEDHFERDFFKRSHPRNQMEFMNCVERELEELNRAHKAVMQKRQEAVEHNADVDREIQRLEHRRARERRVEEKMRSMMKDKKNVAD